MTQTINKIPIVIAQSKAAEIRKRAGIRSVFKTLLLAEAILLALLFADYVARKTLATVQMAPHCQTIGPCRWILNEPIQIAKN